MFLIPGICFGAVLVLRKCASRFRKKSSLRSDITIVAVEYAVLCVLYLLLHHFAAESNGMLPLSVTAACCVLPYAYSLMACDKKTQKHAPLVKRLAVLAVVLAFAEIFVMNLKSFTTKQEYTIIPPEEIVFSGNAEIEEHTLRITGSTTLTLEELPEHTGALLLQMKQERTRDSLPFRVELGMRDDNFTESFQFVQDKYEMADKTTCRLSIHPYGRIYAVQININEVTKPISLKYIRAVSSLPFAFSSLRFWLLFVIGSVVTVVITYQWYAVRYERKKRVHRVCVCCASALCIALCPCLQRPGEESYVYDKAVVHVEDPFAMTFDAFQKGQNWLDLNVDPALEEIDNVYVRDQRDASDAFSYWDLAYYQGHYYAYFGVTPVLVFYYPWYLMTGRLPTVNQGILFFGVLAALFLCLTILELLHLFCPHPNLLLLLLSLPTSCSVCGIYWLINGGGTYHLPPTCALCFLFLCLWTGLRACASKNMTARMLLLVVSGTALALGVGARPSTALNAAVLIPLFVGILFYRRQELRFRLGQAACFVVPLVIGAAGLMHYNQVRFGSPFDFGTSYQLTVSNVNANRLWLTDLWGAIYNYFLITPRPRAAFPFFETQWGNIHSFQHYVYAEGVIGWCSYAAVTAGLLFLPKALHSDSGTARLGTNRMQRSVFLLLCFLVPVLLAWLDFSMGGSCQRYFYDVIPLLMLGCVLVLIRCCRSAEKRQYRYLLTTLAMTSSFVLAWTILIANRDCGLVRSFPNLYNTVEELVVFWQ